MKATRPHKQPVDRSVVRLWTKQSLLVGQRFRRRKESWVSIPVTPKGTHCIPRTGLLQKKSPFYDN